MRMVNVDALLRAFEKIRSNYDPQNRFEKARYEMWSIAIRIVNIVSKSGVDIVRCKECRYWSGCKSTMHNSHRCGRADEHNLDYWTRADDFCSYGEREGE